MSLHASINHYLTDELLARLAEDSTLPLAAARPIAAAVGPLLVKQLAQPADLDELNARWDMCRQLYLSQLLTQPEELLRTDLGWPDRRRYLTQKILGTSQVASLTEPSGKAAQAGTLLGYITVIALAVVGEQANKASLTPVDMGKWLASQQAPAAMPIAALAGLPQLPPAAAAKPKLGMLSAIGSVAVLGLVGGYFMLGNSSDAAAAKPFAAAAVEAAAPVAPAVSAGSKAVAPAATPTAAVVAAPAPAAAAVPVAVATTAAAVHPQAVATVAAYLRDTVGNAALARQVGGKFNANAGRYAKGEGQPLIIKLINRATVTVGINSTESLLYKRLAHPSLLQPANIAIDRLSFDLGQARLGAEGAQQLGSIASLLKTFPKARLVVVGHANNHEAQAMRLGLQRANLAVEELVKQGIAADRLQAQGMLSTELPSDNDSAEKQAMLQGISLKISRL